VQEILPSDNTDPNQTLTLNTTDIETSITQSVQKVGPAVVTVVGTIPGQNTFFGPTGEQTVSGTGFFITDQGYILTNNHVVSTKEVNIILRMDRADSGHRRDGYLFRYRRVEDGWERLNRGKAGELGCPAGESVIDWLAARELQNTVIAGVGQRRVGPSVHRSRI
jgi:hypothetical protein